MISSLPACAGQPTAAFKRRPWPRLPAGRFLGGVVGRPEIHHRQQCVGSTPPLRRSDSAEADLRLEPFQSTGSRPATVLQIPKAAGCLRLNPDIRHRYPNDSGCHHGPFEGRRRQRPLYLQDQALKAAEACSCERQVAHEANSTFRPVAAAEILRDRSFAKCADGQVLPVTAGSFQAASSR